jgi:16S rRNA (uracil1498-N3)-methyltransferase
MRAVWLPSIASGPKHLLVGEAYHHLVNVVRTEAGEDVLLLDGKGLKVWVRVMQISRRELHLQETGREEVQRRFEMDLALGIPKREALEMVLKEATELGIRRIYLVRAAYSQQKVPEADRLQKLLVSALEQSNAPFLPEILESNWQSIEWNEYGLKLLMDSQTEECTHEVLDFFAPTLLVVGPEGGFEKSELSYLHQRPGLEILNLPTPIMRTPTAVATGAGCLLQRLIDRQ